MFTVNSIARFGVLVCLLLVGGCKAPRIDIEEWEVEPKEELFGTLLDDLYSQSGSSVYNMTIVNRYGRTIEETLGSLENVSVLEIGPGRNLAVGVAFVLRGARRYSAVDIYQDPKLYEPVVYQNMNRLARIAGWKQYNFTLFDEIVRVEGERVHLDPDRIEWLYPHESYDFPMAEGTIDFAFSHSGFEHFNEPQKTVERIFQVLKPGGVTAHSIDLRDHDDFSQPHAFLQYSAEEWRGRFSEKNLHNLTNRWRAIDFRQAFENAGFEILEEDQIVREPVTEELKQTFHDDFQGYSLEELSATGLWIVARKPDPVAPAVQPESTGQE